MREVPVELPCLRTFMTTDSDLTLQPQIAALADERPGAVFLRADLQVHTPIDPQFAPRPEPTAANERVELARRYLGAAKERGIELVGITEHNDVSWIDELRSAAQELGIHLLPGFEVESAEGVHVLCLFDPNTSVERLEEVLVGLDLTRAKRSQKRLELNRFIYDDIVTRLKQAKSSRQFLIATHNANIPVLGDAEQIVALDAREAAAGARVKSFVRARGSIDSSDVRAAAEQILEGGHEAFVLRQAKYQA